MGFRFQHGDVADVAALGAMAGQAEKAKRLNDQAMRFAMQVQSQKNALRMAETKMEFQFQAQLRGEAFELEKINIRQQHDFDFQEQRRMDEQGMEHMKEMKRKAGLDNAVANVQEQVDAGFVGEGEGNRLILNLQNKYNMGPGTPMIRPQQESNMLDMLGPQPVGSVDDSAEVSQQKSVLEQQRQAHSEGKVLVQKPNGQLGKVPKGEVEAGLAAKEYKLVGTNYEEQVEQQQTREERERARLKRTPQPTLRRGDVGGMGFYF